MTTGRLPSHHCHKRLILLPLTILRSNKILIVQVFCCYIQGINSKNICSNTHLLPLLNIYAEK